MLVKAEYRDEIRKFKTGTAHLPSFQDIKDQIRIAFPLVSDSFSIADVYITYHDDSAQQVLVAANVADSGEWRHSVESVITFDCTLRLRVVDNQTPLDLFGPSIWATTSPLASTVVGHGSAPFMVPDVPLFGGPANVPSHAMPVQPPQPPVPVPAPFAVPVAPRMPPPPPPFPRRHKHVLGGVPPKHHQAHHFRHGRGTHSPGRSTASHPPHREPHDRHTLFAARHVREERERRARWQHKSGNGNGRSVWRSVSPGKDHHRQHHHDHRDDDESHGATSSARRGYRVPSPSDSPVPRFLDVSSEDERDEEPQPMFPRTRAPLESVVDLEASTRSHIFGHPMPVQRTGALNSNSGLFPDVAPKTHPLVATPEVPRMPGTFDFNLQEDGGNAPADSVPPRSSFSAESTTAPAASRADSCCSVDSGKREIKGMMSDFVRNLSTIMNDSFAADLDEPRAPSPLILPTMAQRSAPIPIIARSPAHASLGDVLPLHRNVWCDACGSSIRGTRWQCAVCPNYDLCASCHGKTNIHPASHGFLPIEPPLPPLSAATPPPPQPQSAAPPVHLDWVIGRDIPIDQIDPNEPPSVHTTVYCDGCAENIVGERSKCVDCDDYDLCSRCILNMRDIHNPEHRFFTLVKPNRIVIHTVDDIFNPPIRSPAAAPVAVPEPEPVPAVPSAEQQEAVDRELRDVSDYMSACSLMVREIIDAALQNNARDIDANTIDQLADQLNTTAQNVASRLDGTSGHVAGGLGVAHQVLASIASSAFIAGAARDALRGVPPPAPASAPAPAPVPAPAPTPAPIAPVFDPSVDHNATCDLCDSHIRGLRWKCLDCPDWDACANCYAIVGEQHPGHRFVRIDRLDQLPRPAGPQRPPHAALGDRHQATCDVCDVGIYGVRYKCMHSSCPDFDMCANCEALPIPAHLDGHPMLKLTNSDMRIPQVAKPTPVPRGRSMQSNNAPLVRHNATCDGCRKQIFGVRYKCMELSCPDFDICTECEGMQGLEREVLHPVTHSLLKMTLADGTIPFNSLPPIRDLQTPVDYQQGIPMSTGPFAPLSPQPLSARSPPFIPPMEMQPIELEVVMPLAPTPVLPPLPSSLSSLGPAVPVPVVGPVRVNVPYEPYVRTPEKKVSPPPTVPATPRPAVGFEDAMRYLDSVKARFRNSPSVYNDFLAAIRDFKAERLDKSSVVARVMTLFQGHQDLVEGFQMFLPTDFQTRDVAAPELPSAPIVAPLNPFLDTSRPPSPEVDIPALEPTRIASPLEVPQPSSAFQRFSQVWNPGFSRDPEFATGRSQSPPPAAENPFDDSEAVPYLTPAEARARFHGLDDFLSGYGSEADFDYMHRRRQPDSASLSSVSIQQTIPRTPVDEAAERLYRQAVEEVEQEMRSESERTDSIVSRDKGKRRMTQQEVRQLFGKETHEDESDSESDEKKPRTMSQDEVRRLFEQVPTAEQVSTTDRSSPKLPEAESESESEASLAFAQSDLFKLDQTWLPPITSTASSMNFSDLVARATERVFPSVPRNDPVDSTTIIPVEARTMEPEPMTDADNAVYASHPVSLRRRSHIRTSSSSIPAIFDSANLSGSPAEEVPDLVATFISNNGIEDGHIFPAGAEFIKSWLMANEGTVAWPETTKLVYVAGFRMGGEGEVPTSYDVGAVAPGERVDVVVNDMKAPEQPGHYIGFWRLSDGNGNFFGHRVWCDVVVAQPESDSDSSLAASSVVMPAAASSVLAGTATISAQSEVDIETEVVVPASPTTSPTMDSDIDTDSDGSASIIELSDESDSEDDWDAGRRSQPLPQAAPRAAAGQHADYVVLYDSASSADEADI